MLKPFDLRVKVCSRYMSDEEAAELGVQKAGLEEIFDTCKIISIHSANTPQNHHLVDARLLKRGKPDPEIFLKAAAELGVEPADCLGVEDAVAGVASIKGAGMPALGIGRPSVLTEADAVIPGLDDFVLDDYLA